MRILKTAAPIVLICAAFAPSPAAANMAPPLSLTVRYPVSLSPSDSEKLARLLKGAGAQKTVVVTCPERTGSDDPACVVKLDQPDAAGQLKIDANVSLTLRGKLEIASQILRRPASGALSSLGQAECSNATDGAVQCQIALDEPVEKLQR